MNMSFTSSEHDIYDPVMSSDEDQLLKTIETELDELKDVFTAESSPDEKTKPSVNSMLNTTLP